MGEEENTDNKQLSAEDKQKLINKGRTTLLQEIADNTKQIARDTHTILLVLFFVSSALLGGAWAGSNTWSETVKDSVLPMIMVAACGVVNYRYAREIVKERLQAIIEDRKPSESNALRNATRIKSK